MASHVVTAYGLTSQDASSKTSFLSQLLGDDDSSTDCEDDLDYPLETFNMHEFTHQSIDHNDARKGLPVNKRSETDDSLSRIKHLPLEIAFEIFVHLHPTDLINISRADRRLRGILTHKESRFIWRACLANVRGLPPCPTDTTEPLFAHLLFNPTCQYCGKNEIKDVFWSCRVRCCAGCVKHQFMTEDELCQRVPSEVQIDKVASIFPYIVLNQYQPKEPSRVLYHRRTSTRYLSELKDALASNDLEKASTWTQLKMEEQIERIKHASLCEHWYNHWVVRRAPRSSEIPLFDLAVTAVLLSALVYLWQDRIFG